MTQTEIWLACALWFIVGYAAGQGRERKQWRKRGTP